MGRGKRLNDVEKARIEAYHESGKSQVGIAKNLKKSRHVIKNFLKNPVQYGTKKRKSYKKKLSSRSERQIARLASNSTKSASEIRRELKLDVSDSTVLRSIKKNPHLKHQKMNSAPRLKPHHIDA